jgi:glyoxylase-like metal-dependent hydrolase (beta-lactamase superfamily II)
MRHGDRTGKGWPSNPVQCLPSVAAALSQGRYSNAGAERNMPSQTPTLAVIDLSDTLIGFYDGRVEGKRYFSAGPNWVDDGGFALGICSYAIHSRGAAIVYDTHLSLAHARVIRQTLEERGIRDIRVVLSHWHLDHIAGNEVFADCEIIACAETQRLLTQNKAAIEAGTLDGAPAIAPLVMPTTTFDGGLDLDCGGLAVELRPFDIHSRDGVAVYLPHDGTFLPGDTLEDTITYVAEPGRLAQHLDGLQQMAASRYGRILPNHGSKARIINGGYGAGLISATRLYVERLLRVADDAHLAELGIRDFLPEPLADGSIEYFEPYEAVHRGNIADVLAAHGKSAL